MVQVYKARSERVLLARDPPHAAPPARCHGGGTTDLDGDYDEKASRASFQEALMEWRQSKAVPGERNRERHGMT